MGAGSSVKDNHQLPSVGDVDSWPTSVVIEALNSWGLKHLEENFAKENINGRLFLRLDEIGFKELGCTALEASRLVMYIDEVKSAGRVETYSPSSSPRKMLLHKSLPMTQYIGEGPDAQPAPPPRWDSAATANKQLIEKSIQSSSALWLDGKYDKTYDMLDDVATLLVSRPLKQPALASLKLEAYVSKAQKRAGVRVNRSAKNASVILRKCLQSYLEQLSDAIDGMPQKGRGLMSQKREDSLKVKELERKLEDMERRHRAREAKFKQDCRLARAGVDVRSEEKLYRTKEKCKLLESRVKKLSAKCFELETLLLKGGKSVSKSEESGASTDPSTRMCEIFGLLDERGVGFISTPALTNHIDSINAIFLAIHDDGRKFKNAEEILLHFDQNNDGKLVFSEFSDGFMRSNALPSSKSPLNTDTSPSKTPKRKRGGSKRRKKKEHDPSTLSTDGRDAATKTEQKEDGGTQNGNQHKVEAEMATSILTGKNHENFVESSLVNEKNVQKMSVAPNANEQPELSTTRGEQANKNYTKAEVMHEIRQAEATSKDHQALDMTTSGVNDTAVDQSQMDASALIARGKKVIYLEAEAADAFNEFIGILQEHIDLNSENGEEQAIRETFNVFDEDGSGEIDVIELQHAMIDMGVGQDSEGNGGLSMHTAKELMTHIDTEGEGSISYEKFKALLVTVAKVSP